MGACHSAQVHGDGAPRGCPGCVWAATAGAERGAPSAAHSAPAAPDSARPNADVDASSQCSCLKDDNSSCSCGLKDSCRSGGGSGADAELSPGTPSVSSGDAGCLDDVEEGACPLSRDSLQGLQLDTIIGRWGGSLAYHGSWQGRCVAVTITEHQLGSEEQAAALEARLRQALAPTLDHPQLVPLHRCAALRLPVDACDGACDAALGDGTEHGCAAGDAPPAWWRPPSRRHLQVWAVSELPELGTLEDAIRIGQLRAGRQHPASPADLHRVLLTALDVASGLEHLHAHGLVSGELAGASVHMCAAPGTERGFTAKLSSAVHAVCHEEVARASRGRDAPRSELLAHTAPEVLLEHAAPTPASDVYSLGVLLWEMFSGSLACTQLSPSQLLRSLMARRDPLPLLTACPPRYHALVNACTAFDPKDRPSSGVVVAYLQAMLAMELPTVAELE